jgi:hypothetical protein
MHFENDPGFESHHRRLVGRNSASGAAPERHRQPGPPSWREPRRGKKSAATPSLPRLPVTE